MDFLNNIAEQLRELFASMTPGARITAGLLAAVVAVSVAFLFQQSSGGGGVLLFPGEVIPSSQQIRMVAAISQAGLSEYDTDGGQIRVPAAKKDQYIAAIADAGALPTTVKEFMDTALNSGSVFDSREVKQQRIKAARENQLTHIITLMPWVDQAAVLYEEQAGVGLRRISQVSASVSVAPAPGESLNSRRVKNLQRLVAGFHPSLSPERVTINNLGADDVDSGQMFAEDFDDPYFSKRVKYEAYVRNMLMEQLSYIPKVRIHVNAVLDEMQQRRTVEVKPSDKPVATSEITETEKIVSSTTDNGGLVGVTAQGPSRPKPDEAPRRQNQSETTRNLSDTQNRVGTTSTEEVHNGNTPKEVWASIEVPRNFVIETWKQRKRDLGEDVPEQINPTELAQVETDIKQGVERAVKPLLPTLKVGENEWSQMEVVFIDTMPDVVLPEPSVASEALAWSGRNWGAFSMVGVALVSLLLLRSVTKPAPTDSAPGAPELRLSASGAEQDAEDDEGPERPRLKLRKADSLKDDLAEIVREDPDAAAAILRGWIGAAG
ncbi:flagellar MS-ring protein [Pirellulimonas nuda]|uniref:Flagellar MS-ring protein n=1 Tax=Pirellulimonas nuda TaxID=2528009 RepID=A0A518D9S7_9BACT|nr:hypothetical protein [Pirellulimonas nuda]QDU88234.1 flagellar MS-ring protein [Pirellulimonas nuda]